MSKVKVDDISIDDLIALAKTPPSQMELQLQELGKEALEKTEAHRWVLIAGVKNGNTEVTLDHIYGKYQQWAGKGAIGKMLFAKQFQKLFRRYRNAAATFYLLEPAPFYGVENSEIEEAEKKPD